MSGACFKQVISTARTCNCILIVLDAIKPITHKRLIEKELEGFGIRSVPLFLFLFLRAYAS
jgi:ribosome-interacting GTPase 1